jgi:hypothetical protein
MGELSGGIHVQPHTASQRPVRLADYVVERVCVCDRMRLWGFSFLV